jgi:hypothetical protein
MAAPYRPALRFSGLIKAKRQRAGERRDASRSSSGHSHSRQPSGAFKNGMQVGKDGLRRGAGWGTVDLIEGNPLKTDPVLARFGWL